MTQGQMTFKSGNQEVIVYAWHDGHIDSAIKELLELPEEIVRIARREKFRDGYCPFNTRLWILPNKTEEQFRDEMKQILYGISNDTISYAGFFCSLHFNRWFVVPNESYVPYPGNNVTITIGKEGYRIEIHEYAQELSKILESRRYNSRISFESDLSITVPFTEILLDELWLDYQAQVGTNA
jgi:hypothetical protein